ncbi:MAG: ATP phosphoribosyltransferase regulatory subunit, partial [Corynebacterium sp.]|uniref:HisS family protein n=1 Tax=Corynebacterium sp. TaxID=1720 RepID=UPI00180603FA
PLMLDNLCDECRVHFDTVKSLLEDMNVPFVINPRMVRGLDYYTKTTFEFVHDGLGAQSGIGGGGRYDGLMAQLGGQDLSGIGFGLGVDRAVLALEAEGKTIPGVEERAAVFGVALGEEAKKMMVNIINDLRLAGISSDMSYGDRGLKGAMKGADRAGARFALVLGDQELANGTVALKDLAAHEQEDVAIEDIVKALKLKGL